MAASSVCTSWSRTSSECTVCLGECWGCVLLGLEGGMCVALMVCVYVCVCCLAVSVLRVCVCGWELDWLCWVVIIYSFIYYVYSCFFLFSVFNFLPFVFVCFYSSFFNLLIFSPSDYAFPHHNYITSLCICFHCHCTAVSYSPSPVPLHHLHLHPSSITRHPVDNLYCASLPLLAQIQAQPRSMLRVTVLLACTIQSPRPWHTYIITQLFVCWYFPHL